MTAAAANLRIRCFRETDREAVRNIWREQLIQNQPYHDIDISIDRKMAYQPELFFVGELDNQVVGTVMAGYDGHRGWLYAVAVDERYKRRGIARALVAHAEEALRKLDCVKINLQVEQGRDEVIGFWEALGWETHQHTSMGKALYK